MPFDAGQHQEGGHYYQDQQQGHKALGDPFEKMVFARDQQRSAKRQENQYDQFRVEVQRQGAADQPGADQRKGSRADKHADEQVKTKHQERPGSLAKIVVNQALAGRRGIFGTETKSRIFDDTGKQDETCQRQAEIRAGPGRLHQVRDAYGSGGKNYAGAEFGNQGIK